MNFSFYLDVLRPFFYYFLKTIFKLQLSFVIYFGELII